MSENNVFGLMELRSATSTDIEQIAEIHAASWCNTYHRVLTKKYLKEIAPGERRDIWRERLSTPKKNQNVIVMEAERQILGFACVYIGENAVWGSYLDNLHVRKEFQGKGIGGLLLRSVAHLCHDCEPDQGLCLLVNQDNTTAQDFYSRFGARNVQESLWDAPDGSCVPTYWFVWDRLDDLINNSLTGV